MDLTPYVDDLQDRLVVGTEAAGDDARALARRLTAPLDAAVRLVLLDALSTAVGEISAELAPGSVDLRLRGGEPEFVVAAAETRPATDIGSGTTPGAAHPAVTSDAPPGPADADDGATTRTTLRLPDHLKAKVEGSAARDGVSVNTWLVRAVAAALDQQSGRPTGGSRRAGNRITGWVR